MRKLFAILLLALLPALALGQANQQSKSVSLITFGADPTGNTDVYSAFNKAILAGATHIDVPPGQYLLAGAGTVALNNIEIECRAAPAQGLTPPAYGTTGATFLLTSTSVQPFTVQGGVRIKGCNFFWPNQNGTNPTPTAYPPLFTEPAGKNLYSFQLVSDRIVNAYDVLDQANTTDTFGEISLTDTMGYAVRYWFQLSNVVEYVRLTGFVADAGLYQNVAATGNNYLANWTAANGAVLHVFGNGNGSTGSTALVQGFTSSGLYVFAYNKLIWVDGTGTLTESKVSGIYDGVPRALEVDSGGCLQDLEVDGSFYSYQVVFPNFGAGQSDNAPMVSLTGAAGLGCGISGVRIVGDLNSAQGDVIDATGVGVKGLSVSIHGGGPYGFTTTAGTYYFAQINSAAAIADFYGNHIEPGRSIGSTRLGLNFINCLTCTATGNSFNGVYNPIIVGGSNVKVMAVGNIAISTPAGGAPVVGTGDFVHRLLTGNLWDLVQAPALSACGTSPTFGSNQSSDISGIVGIGSGTVTSCTITFANAWGTVPRCYVQTEVVAANPATPTVSTSSLVVSTPSSMGSGTLFYHCDAGW